MDILTNTLDSLWQVLLIGLVLGAGLPAIFAFGIRSLSSGTVNTDGSVGTRTTAGIVGGIVCFGVVVVAVVAGLLFISKDFIDHQFGISLF